MKYITVGVSITSKTVFMKSGENYFNDFQGQYISAETAEKVNIDYCEDFILQDESYKDLTHKEKMFINKSIGFMKSISYLTNTKMVKCWKYDGNINISLIYDL